MTITEPEPSPEHPLESYIELVIEDELRANVIAKIRSHISNKDATRKTSNSCDILYQKRTN